MLLAGCSGDGEDAPAAPLPEVTAPVPGVTLPADALRPLVPSPAEVPPGLVPLLAATGPRDAKAIAGFSSDPAKAGAALKAHGFQRGYAAQYAHPSDGRVVSVVVTRFASASGAKADLDADLAGLPGRVVKVPPVGDQAQARVQPLPGGKGELVTLRFRKGATTWLIAYGARATADPQVAVELARAVLARV